MSSNSHVHKPDVALIRAKCSVQMWAVVDSKPLIYLTTCGHSRVQTPTVLTEVYSGSRSTKRAAGSKTDPGLY